MGKRKKAQPKKQQGKKRKALKPPKRKFAREEAGVDNHYEEEEEEYVSIYGLDLAASIKQIPNVGAKRVAKLTRELGIRDNLSDLMMVYSQNDTQVVHLLSKLLFNDSAQLDQVKLYLEDAHKLSKQASSSLDANEPYLP